MPYDDEACEILEIFRDELCQYLARIPISSIRGIIESQLDLIDSRSSIIQWVSEELGDASSVLASAYSCLEELSYLLSSETLRNSSKDFYLILQAYFLYIVADSNHIMVHFFEASAVTFDLSLHSTGSSDVFCKDPYSLFSICPSKKTGDPNSPVKMNNDIDSTVQELINESKKTIQIYKDFTQYESIKDGSELDWQLIPMENLFYCFTGLLRKLRKLRFQLASID